MYKKKQRMKTFSIHADESDPDDRVFEIEDTTILQDESLHLKNSIGELEKALMELNEDFSVVIVLRDIHELNYEEISDIYGSSFVSVQSRIHIVCAHRQEFLADYV